MPAPVEIKAEPKVEPRVEAPIAVKNLEDEFIQMLAKIELKHDGVRAKRAELGALNFAVRPSTEGLELVAGVTEPAEETYYGFMLVSRLEIGNNPPIVIPRLESASIREWCCIRTGPYSRATSPTE